MESDNTCCLCSAFFTRRGSSVPPHASLPSVMLFRTRLCGSATFWVPLCQLMDIWIASSLGPLVGTAAVNFYLQVFVQTCVFFPPGSVPTLGNDGSCGEFLFNLLKHVSTVFPKGLNHLDFPPVTCGGPTVPSRLTNAGDRGPFSSRPFSRVCNGVSLWVRFAFP